MKKTLLATTALAGLVLGGAAHAGPNKDNPVVTNPHGKVSISGVNRFQYNVLDNDVERSASVEPLNLIGTDRVRGFSRNYEFRMDESEIEVKGIWTSDDGLNYGFEIELNTAGHDTTNIDEGLIFFSGSWGRVELGNEDDVASRMAVGGEDAQVGFGGIDALTKADGDDMFNFGQGHIVLGGVIDGQNIRGPFISATADSTKISLFTPRYYGFRLGYSYVPDSGQNGDELTNNQQTGNAAGNLNAAARRLSIDTDFEQVHVFGVEYKENFGKLGVQISGVGAFGDDERMNGVENREELESWQIGAKLDYAGFSLAGAYADFGDSGLLTIDKNNGTGDIWWWDIGLSYRTGPWGFSAGYFHSEVDVGATFGLTRVNGNAFDNVNIPVADRGDVDVDTASVSVEYVVAPGLRVMTDVIFADVEYIAVPRGVVANAQKVDNDGFMWLLGTEVSF